MPPGYATYTNHDNNIIIEKKKLRKLLKQTIHYASKKIYFFLILLCNVSIPGNHSNHVIMNPDIFCLRIKLSCICI